MQSSVIYNFKGGDPDDYAQYLTIDSQTGVPSVIKAVADSDAPSFFVIVEAIEDSELRHSQQTTLWIQIVGRNTTSPTRPPEQSEPYSSSTDTYRVVAIVLGVLFGLALIVLIVFVVCTMKGKMKATPVLPKTIGKLSLVKKRDAAGTESDPKSGATRERESVRSIAMRRTSGDSGVDFLRSLSNPTTSDLGGRPLSTSDTVRDPDVDQLAGTTEISLSGNSPDRRRSGVSTISASELVPYEDNAELVGSAVSPAGSGEERMGMSNPVYEAEGNTDVDVSVVPLEQAHIVI
ncbi:hypothetical protein V1264_011404 [Littorina saxatilis]|uniref:Cadherin domain-containing protein n=2 Tax=Littorina saxatilis TaxID=31220 RepID=A0AAN9BUN1_9CAEN